MVGRDQGIALVVALYMALPRAGIAGGPDRKTKAEHQVTSYNIEAP